MDKVTKLCFIVVLGFFGVFMLAWVITLIAETPKAFAKQELYKQKTGRDIGFFVAMGMSEAACMPSEADKTYNINLGSAKKEK